MVKKLILGMLVTLFVLSAQQPTCNKCNASYVSKKEIQSYLKRAHDNGLTDQQTRAVSIGKATGPDILDMKRRPADLQTVREFNGPGNGGSSIRNAVTHELKAGDVIVIPAGTGHWFTKIDDHIRYVMVRIDPDKVLPLKDEAASQTYLKSPVTNGKGTAKGK